MKHLDFWWPTHHKPRKRASQGFTFLETVLALGIGSLVIISLATAFQISTDSMDESTEYSELLQHGRIAMARMTNDLRYATSLIDTRPTLDRLHFNTTILEDADNQTTEVVQYSVSSQNLYRQVDAMPVYLVAGTILTGETIDVSSMTITPMKVDGFNQLVALDVADNISLAVAVQIELTLQDDDGDTINLMSIVKLRNKFS